MTRGSILLVLRLRPLLEGDKEWPEIPPAVVVDEGLLLLLRERREYLSSHVPFLDQIFVLVMILLLATNYYQLGLFAFGMIDGRYTAVTRCRVIVSTA